MARKIHITDVALRDGHQSLLATRLRTEDMLPACEALNKAGYWSLEVWGGATFDACVRFLKEDPWERLIALRKALPDTRLQMLLRGQNLLGYRHYADDVVRAFVEKSAELGIDVFRIFDALNDERNLRTAIEATKAAGKHAQGTICYTVSPVHTMERFEDLARSLVDMGSDSVAIKDMAGLLTPSATAELVERLKKIIEVPLFLHTHATSGMAPMCLMKAVEAGIDHIDTALSPLAGGTSHTPTETMVVTLEAAGYDTGINLDVLKPAAKHLRNVRKKYAQFESDYSGVDTEVLTSQVPGGMMSNLSNQLKEQGALDKIDDVFTEIPAVRKDLGYPPLVTPTSQIVGSQAAVNVMSGKRYASVTNEVKRYLQGGYGRTPAPVDQDLLKAAIGNEEVITHRPADDLQDEMATLKSKVQSLLSADGGKAEVTDTDVLIYAMFPDLGGEYLKQRAAGTLQPEVLLDPAVASASQVGAAVSSEFKIALHGEQYDVAITGLGPKGKAQRRIYLTVDGVPEEVIIETFDTAETGQTGQQRPQAGKPGHIATSMPGNVVDVLVKKGDKVDAGQALLIIEAMKMETEIRADVSGTVSEVYAKKGDRVAPAETLVAIQQD
ncbi:sodium-extruding oxaloacetate decarboxylase subunit alpha [Allohahella sp. A8]|uniref:sodium-extruding oxaloacetate decarboxylase subunit alpha n=1 Tax=Allohahella sp. A8 TaxID=3141461 RepID=UPI000C094DD8|nr:oxaloacetate decarboxylase subunit alpha [Hahellaceae bacterium]|tara:strand:+ start:38561 stop:40393 length:1833 start_codon:yes stop_codon:yes gene_type:complete